MSLAGIKRELEELKGAEVRVFEQPTILDSDCGILVDAIEVIDHLSQFELTVGDLYDIGYDIETDWDGDIAKCQDHNLSEYYKEVSSDNSYNWSSLISHDFYIYKYKSLDDETYIYKIAFHKYGDVRGNYTQEAYLKFDDEDQFLYELIEVQSCFNIEVDGIEFSCSASAVDSQFNCSNDELGDFEAWGTDEREIIEAIREAIK